MLSPLQPEEVAQCRVAGVYANIHAKERECSTGEDGHFAQGRYGRCFHSARLRYGKDDQVATFASLLTQCRICDTCDELTLEAAL